MSARGSARVRCLCSVYALVLCGTNCALHSQTAPTVESLREQLRANAEGYAAHLPSLACREHITSQSMNNRGTVARSTEADDVLRVLRQPPGNDPPAVERRVPVNAAGEAQDGKAMPVMPLTIADGFFAGQTFFSNLSRQACVAWSLDTTGSKLRLGFQRNPAEQLPSSCQSQADGLEGFALVDRVSGEMVFQKRSITPEAGRRERRATYVEINYAPVRFDEETYWLPQRIYAEMGPSFRYTATYSGCKRYATKSRVVNVGPVE